MKQLSLLYSTKDHYAGLISRLTLAGVLLPHGCQLLLGWFGGGGFTGTMTYLTQAEGLPWMIGLLVILLQSVGALLLLLGFMGRFLAFAMAILFTGMVVTSHWQHGFFMNWMGNQQGEGFEFHLLAIGLSLAILVSGSGSYSLDAIVTRKWKAGQLSFNLQTVNV